MKNITFFFTLILCMMVSAVSAQNTTRGAKATTATQETISTPKYSFTKALSVNENSKEIAAEEVVFASATTPVRKNASVTKKATQTKASVSTRVGKKNARVCQSQPLNIHKTVTAPSSVEE